ncbi:MAG: glycosyltransferase family 39 protein [Terrimicrobiaceae bacterium]
MSVRNIFFVVVGALTLARVGILLSSGVSPGNAYFSICAEHPALAYFDGPAGSAMLGRALGAVGERWWLVSGPVWALLASLAAWRLGTRLFGEKAAGLGVVAWNLVPAFQSAAFSVGPEMPALAFSLTGASLIWDVCRNQRGALLGWVAAAFAFAGAVLFAYWAALVAVACVLAPWTRDAGRRLGNGVGAALVLIAVAIALAPALIWNQSKSWIPLAGSTFRGLMEFQPQALGGGLLGFFSGVSPLLALAVIWAICKLAGKAAEKPATGFALIVALPSLLLTVFFAYRGWDAATISLLALAVWLPAAATMLRSALFGVAMVVAAGLSVPVWLAYPHLVAVPRQAAEAVLALEEKLSPQLPEGIFFIATDAPLASSLGYHLRMAFIAPEGYPRVHAAASQDISNQYALWPSYDDFVETPAPADEFFTEVSAVNPYLGHAALYVGRERPENLPSSIRSAFSEVQLVQEVGKGQDALFIYLCLDYQTLPL